MIILPEFYLMRRYCVVLNKIRTGHGNTGQMLYKCDCKFEEQTVYHIIEECLRGIFNGGVINLYMITSEVINQISNFDIKN